MFRGKESIFVTVICAAGMGAFVAFWLLDFAVVRISACEASETRGLCLRGWMSALSGWAAAIGALIAAGLTISKLRVQIEDQKRQTDFMIGDTIPSVEFSRTSRNSANIVIKNYNRRKIEVTYIRNNTSRKIRMTFGKDAHGVPIIHQIEEETEQELYGHRVFIDGWENRSHRPPSLETTININTDDFIDELMNRDELKINICIKITIHDEFASHTWLKVRET